jgi:hypothetical protein
VTFVRQAVTGLVVALVCAAASPSFVAAESSGMGTQSWYRQVVHDLRPLQTTLPGMLNAASSWAGGSESAAAARQEFSKELPQLQRVHRTLQNLPPLNGHQSAHADYGSAIGLYVDALQVDEAATEIPAGVLQSQLQHSSQRIRELGDNVFDQGTAELAPQLGSNVAGPDVAAAANIPDWTTLGLQPGLPLVSSWNASTSSGSRTQPTRAWVAEVEMDGAPSQSRVQRALLRTTDLGQSASTLSAAEAFDSSIPAPSGDSQRANRRRLGLLVDAEALMAAQAAHLSSRAPAQALRASASDLGAIGGRLRSEG